MTDDPRPRFVVLGASNVARGFTSLARRIRSAHAGPVEILAAHGRGRSYGMTSRYLWTRELVSIDACGLWPVLGQRSATTNALLCDIGNDLAYGAPVEDIASWVERALDRLHEHEARTVVVGLPLASLERLGRLRFEIARSLMFPGRALELSRLLDAARLLEEHVSTAARARNLAFVSPAASWFGIDPIHLRPWLCDTAWKTYLASFEFQLRSPASGLSDRVLFLRRQPECRRVFGREQRRAQPCVWFGDGTSISEF